MSVRIEMSIRIELYGIPRERAGVATALVEATRLGEALRALTAQFPRLAEECFDEEHLRSNTVANLNGERFIRDPDTVLSTGDALLIFSADAGGC